MITERAPIQIVAIDLLRFACAVSVMAFHYLTIFPLHPRSIIRQFDPTLMLGDGAARWAWFGYIGVPIFFVVSGFVIARSAVGMTPRGFLHRRVLRLAPSAWICASFSALCLLVFRPTDEPTILFRWAAAMAFVPIPEPIDSVYWTLSVETCFYVLVAFCLRKDGRSDGGDDRRIERIGWLIGAASIAYWLGVLTFGPIITRPIDTFSLWLLPYGVFFTLGILLWLIRADMTPARAALTIIMFMASCGQIAHTAYDMASLPHVIALPAAPIIIFAAAIALIMNADRLQAPLIRAFGRDRLITLGLMTYPLYLLHQPLGAVVALHAMRLGLGQSAAMTLAAASAIAAAWGITRGLERPLRHWLAARLAKMQAATLPHARRQDSPPSAFLPDG